MKEPTPETWKHSHMLALALSRWDNEGGARPHFTAAGLTGATLPHAIQPSVNAASQKRAPPSASERATAASVTKGKVA